MIAGLTLGCADKAKPDYASCVQLKAKGDAEAAWKACNDAVGADPNSTSGRGAAELLTQLKPDYEKAKTEREGREAKEAAQRRIADEAIRANKLAHAKLTVEGKFHGFERDGECTAKGLPPYRKSYEGGTFEEDEIVALGDRCVHLFPGRSDALLFTVFCCPR